MGFCPYVWCIHMCGLWFSEASVLEFAGLFVSGDAGFPLKCRTDWCGGCLIWLLAMAMGFNNGFQLQMMAKQWHSRHSPLEVLLACLSRIVVFIVLSACNVKWRQRRQEKHWRSTRTTTHITSSMIRRLKTGIWWSVDNNCFFRFLTDCVIKVELLGASFRHLLRTRESSACCCLEDCHGTDLIMLYSKCSLCASKQFEWKRCNRNSLSCLQLSPSLVRASHSFRAVSLYNTNKIMFQVIDQIYLQYDRSVFVGDCALPNGYSVEKSATLFIAGDAHLTNGPIAN